MPSRISRSPLILWIRTPKISIKPVRIDQELYTKGQKKLYVFVFSRQIQRNLYVPNKFGKKFLNGSMMASAQYWECIL